MPLSRSDAARVAELWAEAGRPYATVDIIMKATDLDDAKRRLAATDPKTIAKADMLKQLGVTEEQAATMRAARAPEASAPQPARSATNRADANRAVRKRQAVEMALGGGFPGVVR